MKYQGISALTHQPVEISVQAGSIETITPLTAVADDLPYIAPGWLDMQVNGYQGSDYSLDDFSIDHLHKITESLAASGTTQHVPTIVTSPRPRLLRTLRLLAEAMETSPDLAAAIAGIHVEGPYISDEDGPRGAHDPSYVRNPDVEEFQEWQDAARGAIKIVTIAPEREGALAFIRAVSATGVIVALGHTAADPEQIQAAVEAGARLSTHLGNGSHAMIPRLKNYIWEQLAADELMAGLITDGFHLPQSVVKVFVRAKGLKRLILVSDVALLGGCQPGVYKWGNLDVEVFADGHLGLPGTSFLAGAGHLLDWDIAHFINFTGYDLADTLPLCTTHPARVLHLEHSFGTLEVGAPANVVLFTFRPGDDRLDIMKTIRAGKEVFTKNSTRNA
ncbi:amidohydrolase family protein [candidate division KSB3 bacterium]|uniref:Amidohydrolase family protein n=1 Tax=candidate division KSB3 bacterium TaxID=2044937 RepID=A0A9D5JYA3_9BACT|nr:amidohydrolase family protein [candidate division KSB3 bacterium]MBD3326211.1 amidohydrolase family protein [candidate division KSB3 bacterium]